MQKIYELLLSKEVEKFLDSHPEISVRFYKKTTIILDDPWSQFLDIVLLSGVEDTWRLRIGKYRFTYTIIEDKLIVYFIDADSRGDIYKA